MTGLTNMMRAIFAAGLWVCVVATTAFAQEPLGIVTGPKTGTYYAIARDISDAAAKEKIKVEIKSSEGSIDNIRRINSNENAALGIVQSDVMGFLSRSKNPESEKMAGNLRVVFPLYDEEVHVFASKAIPNFRALHGKRVAIGEEGSGNMLTSINLFSIMGVSPAETIKISPEQGVLAVLRGELDAVIFVSGKPVRLFKNLENLNLPENQKFSDLLENMHFVPLDAPKIYEEYQPAQILPSDYYFVRTPVETVSVPAYLISYDFAQSKDKARCSQLGKLAGVLRSQLPRLQENGHAKWKEVKLDASPGKWQRDSCAWPSPAPAPKKKDRR